MTYEEYSALNREERMRARMRDLALVGATQTRLPEPAISDMDSSADSEMLMQLKALHDGRSLKTRPKAGKERNASFGAAILQISRDTRIGEETVLRIIETYEKTALRD